MKYKIVCYCFDKNQQIIEKLKNNLKNHSQVDDDYEFLFVVGGDGTIISALTCYFEQDIKIVHIKSGTNSFLGEELDDESWINKFLESTDNFESYQLIQMTDNKQTIYAINEIYIQGSLFLKMKIKIQNNIYEEFRGLGILFSTQIGSTGLSKSLGSPIILPQSNSWLMTPLGAQSNKNYLSIINPLVISEKEHFNINLLSKNTIIFIDNKKTNHLFDETNLVIQVIKSRAKVFRLHQLNLFINRLNSHFTHASQ